MCYCLSTCPAILFVNVFLTLEETIYLWILDCYDAVAIKGSFNASKARQLVFTWNLCIVYFVVCMHVSLVCLSTVPCAREASNCHKSLCATAAPVECIFFTLQCILHAKTGASASASVRCDLCQVNRWKRWPSTATREHIWYDSQGKVHSVQWVQCAFERRRGV